MIPFVDRVPTYPGRMKITKEDDGSVEYVVMERADEPVVEGTPINKALFDSIGGSMTYTIALPASGWSGAAPFTQTVSASGITENDMPIVDVDMSSATTENAAGILEAWFCIGRIATGNGTLTAYCYEAAPSIDLNVIVKVV